MHHVLLEAVKSQDLIVDLHAERLRVRQREEKYILHIFQANSLGVGGQRGGKHHHLLVEGRLCENLVNISTAIYESSPYYYFY